MGVSGEAEDGDGVAGVVAALFDLDRVLRLWLTRYTLSSPSKRLINIAWSVSTISPRIILSLLGILSGRFSRQVSSKKTVIGSPDPTQLSSVTSSIVSLLMQLSSHCVSSREAAAKVCHEVDRFLAHIAHSRVPMKCQVFQLFRGCKKDGDIIWIAQRIDVIYFEDLEVRYRRY